MYVLATERRALHTVDIDSGLPVAVNVEVERTDGLKEVIAAPGLLPELASVKHIRVRGDAASHETNRDCKEADDDSVTVDDAVHYYPVSLSLASAAAPSVGSMSHIGNKSLGNLMHRQIQVNTLYVKKRSDGMDASHSQQKAMELNELLRDLYSASTGDDKATRGNILTELGASLLSCRPLADVMKRAIAE